MPKYKSTAAYRAADALNKQIKAIYQEFGGDSEIYGLYVNRLSAALPAGSIHISKGGFIQISKSKNSGLTASMIKKAKSGEPKKGSTPKGGFAKKVKDRPLPDVRQAKRIYKRQIAEENLAEKGNLNPSESQIQREARGVSDAEVKSYVDAKSYVRAQEDSRGKLKYDASVADLMATAGAKSYELLRAILEEGETRRNAEAQKEATNAAAVEQGYKDGGANIESQRARL